MPNAKPDDERVPVLFRAERSGQFKGDVTAVFPTLPGTAEPWTMTCYAHIGQHGSCDQGWLHKTRPATPEEYADLKRELERQPYGYKLKVIQRITQAHHKERREALRHV